MSQIDWTFAGYNGARHAHQWAAANPQQVVVISHGYGEHIGRYAHVGDALSQAGAVVVGADHAGHGRSAGPRVSFDDLDDLVDDIRHLVTLVQRRHPDLPTTMIGHSLGGLVAARYEQLHPGTLDRLVLSSPVLGTWRTAERLLLMDPLPDTPLRAELLSRDLSVGRRYADDPWVWHGGFQRNTLEAIATALTRFNEGAPIDAIPVLWLHGDDDRLVPIEGTRTGIARKFGANVAERVFAGARHELLNESSRQEVIAHLTEFVAGSHDDRPSLRARRSAP